MARLLPRGARAAPLALAAPRLAFAALLLAPAPAAGAGAPEPPAEAVVDAIPFVAEAPGYRVMLDLAPPGHRPWIMMLDTGASDSVLTPGMARSLGVSVRRAKTTPYRRATRLGRDLQFWIDTASSDSGSKTGWEYGLLGGEFLDDYVLEIDFPGRVVRFLDPRRYQVPDAVDAPDERVIRFRRAGTRVTVPVAVGKGEADLLLDTGAPDNLLLSGRTARRLGIDVDALPDAGEGGTVLGPMELRFLEAADVRLAGFALGTLPALVAPRGVYNQGTGTDSVLGLEALRPFVLRIDYARGRLWLRRAAPLRPTLYGADFALVRESGAWLSDEAPGRLHVYRVDAGRPAARLGLREDDWIVLEGEPSPGGAGRPSPDEALRRILAGGPLRVERGTERLELRAPPGAAPGRE
jgi:predicted aspartyl protease